MTCAFPINTPLPPKQVLQSGQSPARKGEQSCGTTIIATEFKEGVVLGADSRSSTGIYVASRITDKLTKITDRVYCCRSGSSADTQAVADIVRYYVNFYELETNKMCPVKTIAKLFRDVCYNNKNSLMASILVAGWDDKEGGQIYQIPLGGTVIRAKYGLGGSGSSYITGLMDSRFTEGMTKRQALDYVKKGLFYAMSRDGSSGGIMRTAVITQDGVDKRFHVPPFGYEAKEEMDTD